MAGRSKYSEEDRARAYRALVTHDWVVKAAARETGFPVTTLRHWRDEFQNGINVPSNDAIQEEVNSYLADCEAIRDEALAAMRVKIQDPKSTLAQLTTAYGVLDDKITRAKGLADKTVDHRFQLPSREELAEALTGAMQHAIEQASQRQDEIIDAEVVERPALPAPA